MYYKKRYANLNACQMRRKGKIKVMFAFSNTYDLSFLVSNLEIPLSIYINIYCGGQAFLNIVNLKREKMLLFS